MRLKIDPNLITKIKAQYKEDLDGSMTELLSAWLRQNYDTKTHGKPTLAKLADAVEKVDSTCAQKIRGKLCPTKLTQ